MSVRLNASVGSLAGLVAHLFSADELMQIAARRVVKRNGDRLSDLTFKYCPYDESKDEEDFHMRDYIRQQTSHKGLVVRVGFLTSDFTKHNQPPYYKFVWHGTRFMKANPFPDRAQNEVFPVFKAELGQEVKRAVKRRGR